MIAEPKKDNRDAMVSNLEAKIVPIALYTLAFPEKSNNYNEFAERISDQESPNYALKEFCIEAYTLLENERLSIEAKKRLGIIIDTLEPIISSFDERSKLVMSEDRRETLYKILLEMAYEMMGPEQ